MTKQELLDMIKAGKETAPWANAVRMCITNAEMLGMPPEVFDLEVIVMDKDFPEDYLLVGEKR